MKEQASIRITAPGLARTSPLLARLAMTAALLTAAAPVNAQVNYDTGQRMIDGVQLLQGVSDPLAYYYVPQYPRLASKPDGTLELLCLKYVDAAGGPTAGCFTR